MPEAESTRPSLNANPRAVAKNALAGYITLLMGALLGFVLTPVLLSRLGTTGFGTWSLILGTVAYLSLLEVGLGIATTTRVAMTEPEGPHALGRLISTSLVLSALLGILGLLATAGACAVFPTLFEIPRELVDDARVALALQGVWAAVTFVTLVLTASLLGTGRMYIVNFSGFAVSAAVSVAQVLALVSGGGLKSLAAISLVGAVVGAIVLRYQVARVLPGVRIGRARFHMPTAKRLLGLGWRNSIYSAAGLLAFGSDVVLVGLLLDTKAAAAYAIALRVYTTMQRVTNGVVGPLGPAHAHAAHKSTAERRFDLYCISTYTTLCIATFAGLTVILFVVPLLEIWLGSVPENASTIVIVLCVVLIVQALGMNAAALLLNSEESGKLLRITVAAAAINVGASVAFTLSIGTIGPAVGSLVAVVLVDAIYFPRCICRLLGQQYRDLLRRTACPLLLPLCALLLVLGAGRVVVPSGPWVLAVVAAAATVFFGILWRLPPSRRILVLLREGSAAA